MTPPRRLEATRADRPTRTMVVIDELGSWLTFVVQCDRCYAQLARDRVDTDRTSVAAVVESLTRQIDAAAHQCVPQ
jgi:hypothetical protein